jgi:hypothetical protein
MVAEYAEKGSLPVFETAAPSAQALKDFLSSAPAGAYIGLQAYVPSAAETTTALRALGDKLRGITRLATTVGYGPRFLHSTGQLHKGGSAKAIFVQFVTDSPRDADIPESPMTFSVLKRAQAMGDRRALENGGRKVITFHLGGDAAAAELTRLAEAL